MIDPKASWTEPISSVYELIDLEEVLVKENLESGRRWAYRGQPRDYGSLMPSFQREFLAQSHGTAAIIERDLIREFRMHYGALSDRSRDMPLPTQISDGYDLRCLSVMQHYEIPTRLLDWTSEYWIAVYFACTSQPDQMAELWYYDRSIFDAQLDSEPSLKTLLDRSKHAPMEPPFLDRRGVHGIVELDPRITPRMERQLAHHTVSTNIFTDHAPLLVEKAKEVSPANKNARDSIDGGIASQVAGFQVVNEGVENAGPLDHWSFPRVGRVLIAGECKASALQYLAKYKNITASTIFPDVVGLGRYLRWQFESLRTMLGVSRPPL
jgi:hypothetical protein